MRRSPESRDARREAIKAKRMTMEPRTQARTDVPGVFLRQVADRQPHFRAYARDAAGRQITKSFPTIEEAAQWKHAAETISAVTRRQLRAEVQRLRRERSLRTSDVLGEGYAQLRRLLQLLDRAASEGGPRSRRRVRAVIAQLHGVEDEIGKALAEERAIVALGHLE